MKIFGVVSSNIHCNFTNYGSAVQSWALNRTVERLGYKPILMDYCPDVLRDANPLDPFKKMWDQDAESRRMCGLTMPAKRATYAKSHRLCTESDAERREMGVRGCAIAAKSSLGTPRRKRLSRNAAKSRKGGSNG